MYNNYSKSKNKNAIEYESKRYKMNNFILQKLSLAKIEKRRR